MREHIHTCNYECQKLECIKSQRDELVRLLNNPKKEWEYLNDEDREKAFNSLPDMLDGFMKTWGWLHFSKAIEKICKEKNI